MTEFAVSGITGPQRKKKQSVFCSPSPDSVGRRKYWNRCVSSSSTYEQASNAYVMMVLQQYVADDLFV